MLTKKREKAQTGVTAHELGIANLRTRQQQLFQYTNSEKKRKRKEKKRNRITNLRVKPSRIATVEGKKKREDVESRTRASRPPVIHPSAIYSK